MGLGLFIVRVGMGSGRTTKRARKGWRVRRERPEDDVQAETFYGEQGADAYETNVMRKIQERILVRALLLAKIPEGAKVLDAGCGTGFGMEVLKEAGYEVQGFDVSPAMVEKARAKGFQVKQGDLRSIPFEEGSFDAIVSISALQWVPLQQREKVAKEFWRVLRKGGIKVGSGKDRMSDAMGGRGDPSRGVYPPGGVIQYYPKSEDEMMQTGRIFRKRGFLVKLQIDNADNPRKRKVYMLLEK